MHAETQSRGRPRPDRSPASSPAVRSPRAPAGTAAAPAGTAPRGSAARATRGPAHRPRRAFCGAPPYSARDRRAYAGTPRPGHRVAVVGAYVRQRRDEHVHREVPAQRPGPRPPSAGEASAIRSPPGRPADLPHVPHQPGDALAPGAAPPRSRAVNRPSQRDQFVDVLMRYGQVEQDLGQASSAIRQHDCRFSPPIVSRGRAGPTASGPW